MVETFGVPEGTRPNQLTAEPTQKLERWPSKMMKNGRTVKSDIDSRPSHLSHICIFPKRLPSFTIGNGCVVMREDEIDVVGFQARQGSILNVVEPERSTVCFRRHADNVLPWAEAFSLAQAPIVRAEGDGLLDWDFFVVYQTAPGRLGSSGVV